jgi:hypothetical protein
VLILPRGPFVGGAEHRDRARQADLFGPLGNGRQDDRHRRDDKVEPMVLADGEHIQPGLVRQLGGLEDLLHAFLGADRLPRLGVGEDFP